MISLASKKATTYLDYLYDLDYKERPVDIDKFIEDPYYLGNSTENGALIYPVWRDALREIFEDDKATQIVLTGAIGIGKSTAAIIGAAYIMHRLLCLKNPWAYFGLADISKMAITFFNLTKSLSESRGFGKLQTLLMKSPWFTNQCEGTVRGKNEPYLDFHLMRYILASPLSKGFSIIGEDVILGILDEVDSPTESSKQKERVLKAYESTVRRFKSRFVKDGESIGKLFLVASKQDELSFLEAFVERKKNDGDVKVFDIPLWAAKKGHYSGKTFTIAVGDAFKASKVITTAEKGKFASGGYKLVDVPEEHRQDFEHDLLGALRDLAGITVHGIRRYKLFPSESLITACLDKEKENPVEVSVIETGLQDTTPWISYVNLDRLAVPLDVPRYIHLDISISGDATGIACSCIKGWMEQKQETEEGVFKPVRVPVLETDFVLRIKAKDGDRIPLSKTRKLIIDLRNKGLNIAKFTADLRLASEDTIQILQKADIPAEYFSATRTSKPYMDWHNLVLERRWDMYYNPWVLFEAKNIEFNKDTQKIDHPDTVEELEVLEDGDVKTFVMKGSKDVLDAVVGSVYQALINTKEPFDVQQATDLVNSLADGPKGRPGAMPSDWMISERSKAGLVGKDGKPQKLLDKEAKQKKMLDVLNSL